MGYILPIFPMGHQVHKGSVTGPGAGKRWSWDSNLGLLTLGLNEIETMYAEYSHGIL